MKHTVISCIAAIWALASPTLAARCYADNCARAVTGTRQGLATQSARRADCSSYLSCTYTPGLTTNTITATVPGPTTTTTLVLIIDGGPFLPSGPLARDSNNNMLKDKRLSPPYTPPVSDGNGGGSSQVAPTGTVSCPTQLPPWVPDACNGRDRTNLYARFASACQCAGVAYTTTSLPYGPSQVVTVTQVGEPVTVTTVITSAFF